MVHHNSITEIPSHGYYVIDILLVNEREISQSKFSAAGGLWMELPLAGYPLILY